MLRSWLQRHVALSLGAGCVMASAVAFPLNLAMKAPHAHAPLEQPIRISTSVPCPEDTSVPEPSAPTVPRASVQSSMSSAPADPPATSPPFNAPSQNESPPTSGGLGIGDLATWVGSLLSGISVLLATYLILRDRNQRMRSQAERVVAWVQTDMSGSELVFLRNTSDMPIFRVRVVSSEAGVDGNKVELRFTSEHEADEMGPNTSASRKVTVAKSGELMIRFTAADNIVWERTLATGRLRRHR